MQHDPNQIIAPAEILAGAEYAPTTSGDAPGTVFPSLRGGDPGDTDPGQNLGDFPFGAPLHGEDSMPLADTSSGVVSPAEVQNAEPLPPSGASILEGAAAAVPPGGMSATTRKRSAEERISQLTARYRTAESENSQLQAQIAQLSQIVAHMQQQPTQPSFPRPSGSGEASPSDNPFVDAGPGVSSGVNAQHLRNIVQEAVAPLAQTVSALVNNAQRRTSHEVSFARAVEDFPELGQPGSQARRYFDELYTTLPMAQSPDAPEQIALMVRGALAGARRDSQVSSARKLQSTVQAPTPSISDEVPVGQNRSQQIEAVRSNAINQIRHGDRSFETYRALRLATRARNQMNNR